MARDRQRHLKLRCAPPVRNTFAERQRKYESKDLAKKPSGLPLALTIRSGDGS
jgi:hypothetical protein